MNGEMDIGKWKQLARTAIESPLAHPDGRFVIDKDANGLWEEILDALLRASENEGLPVLDDMVERLNA